MIHSREKAIIMYLYARLPSPEEYRFLFIMILLFCLVKWSNAQDVISSQWQPIIASINPALSGTKEKTTEVGIRFREQWQSIQSGYATTQAFVYTQDKTIAWGGQVWQHRSGMDGIIQTSANIQAAYRRWLSISQRLSIGAGWGIRQCKPIGDYRYDRQFVDGVGFDVNVDNGENRWTETRVVADYIAGVAWEMWSDDNQYVNWQIGGSVAHFHEPEYGVGSSLNRLSTLWGVSILKNIRLPIESMRLTPSVLYQQQGVHHLWQLDMGLSKEINKNCSIGIGVGYRWGDALIAQLKYTDNRLKIWMSYDWNISELSNEIRQSAIEIGIGYYWRKKEGVKGIKKETTLLPAVYAVASIDSDGDGVPDELDRCPLIAGEWHLRGCRDRDMDGVVDILDSCPDVYGSKPNKGCPVSLTDTDKDGIVDEEDYCVYMKGPKVLKGCPDTDGDGLSDIDDQCPYMKGIRAEGGCPKEDINVSCNLMLGFDYNESFLRPEEYQRIIVAINEWNTLSELHLVIAGHTSEEGTHAYNFELAQERANTVKDILNHWIDIPLELTVVSYGEILPLEEKFLVDGKATNRRVEVHVLR